jgi:hypothetical protein
MLLAILSSRSPERGPPHSRMYAVEVICGSTAAWKT